MADGRTIDLHVRFKKKTPLSEIRKALRKTHGSHATVWEYRDGRNVLIVKPKHRSRSAKK